MPIKEWTKTIRGADDIELGIPRASPLIYHCTAPEQGKAEGLAFVVPGSGEDPGGEALRGLRAHLAGTYRLLAVSVGYHCLHSRLSDGARLDLGPAEMASLGQLCARHGVALIDPHALIAALSQLPEPYEFELRVVPPGGDYQNLGLMQALDHFAVLQDIVTGADNAGLDAGDVLVMGHGYGAYLAHLIAKIAPNTVRAVFDFAGLTAAPLSYLWGGRFGGAAPDPAPYYYHAGKVRLFPLLATEWSDDKTSPHYFSAARRAVRDTASPQQCQAMRQSTRRPCCYRFGLPGQAGAFIDQKRKQADVLRWAGFDVGVREAGGGGIEETTPPALLRRLFDENYPKLPAAPATPDHLLGSSIAYLCQDTIYSFEHGSWGCKLNVVPMPPPSPAARLYKFV